MLLHGLKRLHGIRLYAPYKTEDRPDPALLQIRYDRFLEARG